MGDPNRLYFQAEAHAGFFQVLAKDTVDQTYSGEVLDAGEANIFYLLEKDFH